MKDILGKELEIGDIVLEIATNCSWYMAGKITRFSAKSVFFIYKMNDEGRIFEKFVKPKYLIKVSIEDLISIIQPDGAHINNWQSKQVVAFIEEFCTVPIEE